MEQYVLYLILKEMVKNLDPSFKYTFNDMDSNSDDSVGIYIKGAEPSEYRSLKDGKYFNSVNRVQFLVQGGLDNSSLLKSLKLCSKIKGTLISINNKYIQAPPKVGYNNDGEIVILGDEQDLEPINVVITKVDLLSDILYLGKSKQGRPRYSINFKITYEIGG